MIITKMQMQVEPAQIMRRRWNRRRTSSWQTTTNRAQDSAQLLMEIRGIYEETIRRSINDDDFPYCIFVVSDGVRRNITTANGLAHTGKKICLIFNRSLITTAHELGHNLGLPHTFQGFSSTDMSELRIGKSIVPQSSTLNFMDYKNPDDRRFFYKCQYIFVYTKHYETDL